MIEKVQLNSVKDFEDVRDVYQVCREGGTCWVEGEGGKVISGAIGKSGYRQIGLYLKSSKRKMFLQHRIFMLSFIPNPENKSQVNHLDSNRSNNSLENLVWCDNSENQLHAFRNGNQKPNYGERHGRAKLKDSQIPLIFEMRKTGMTQKVIANYFGISRPQISLILSGKQRSK